MMPATPPSPASLVPMIGFCALLVVAMAQGVALALLPRVVPWSSRRELQLFVLALPALALAFSALPLLSPPGAPVCSAWPCAAPGGGVPAFLSVLVAGLAALPAAVAAGALTLGIVRLALLHRTVARRSAPAPDELA